MICTYCRWYNSSTESCFINWDNDEETLSAKCCEDISEEELEYICKGGDDNE